MRALDPRWAGGRPRRIRAEDEAFLIQTATTRPAKLSQPFTHWSLRKLVGYLADDPRWVVRIGRERARRLLADPEITLQRTKTWKESPDPERGQAGPHRRGLGPAPRPDLPLRRVRSADHPAGSGHRLGAEGTTGQLPANYHKTAGVRRYFHGCYSIADDRLWGVVRQHKSAANTLAALRSIRAARPGGDPIYVIMDNLSAHKGPKIRSWAARHAVRLDFTPTYASWADPIEPHFGSLRSFVVAGSDHPNHVVLTRALHEHLRWRNAHARHPDVLAAQRRERARVRSEHHRHWGQAPTANGSLTTPRSFAIPTNVRGQGT